MNHVMIDIETLGTAADTVVLSIGAVRFDPRSSLDGGGPYDEFYAVLETTTQLANGRTINHETFKWWMRQNRQAQLAIAGKDVQQRHTKAVMIDLAQWMPDKPSGVWGNGSDFDNAILQHMAGQYNISLWPFWTNRCFRTFTNLFDPKKQLRPVANNHHALMDCINQIGWMQNIVAEHGIEI